MGASSSKSSNTAPTKQPMPSYIKDYPRLQELEPKQEVGFFAQYLPRKSSTDEVSPQPTDYHFWSCTVETTNKAKERDEFDVLLDCQASCTDPTVSKKSLPNQFKIWMMKEYNERYQVKKPQQEDIDHFLHNAQFRGGAISSIFFPEEQHDKKNVVAGKFPQKLAQDGFQVGPFKEDLDFINSYAASKDDVEANMKVRTPSGNWGLYEARDWQLYSGFVAHFVTIRSMANMLSESLGSFKKYQ